MRWQVIRFRGGRVRYRIEPQIIRIDNRGRYHLGRILFPAPNRYSYELAVLLKNKHQQQYKRPLLIQTASMATEIWGHTHLDLFYRFMLKTPVPKILRRRYEERLRNTSIIDIGVRAVDNNRIVWDIGNRIGGWIVFRSIKQQK